MGFKAKAKLKASKSAARKKYNMDINDFSNPDHYRQVVHYTVRGFPFDLEFFLSSDVSVFGNLYPSCYHEYECGRAQVDKCVRHAIVYAKKEKKMELEDPVVVNANQRSSYSTMYYITFDARDKRSVKRQLYDAKVLHGSGEYHGKHDIHVRIIRVKNSKKKYKLN